MDTLQSPQRKVRHRISPSSLQPRTIHSAKASSQVWRVLVAMSPACRSNKPIPLRSDWRFCVRSSPVFDGWRSWPIPTIRAVCRRCATSRQRPAHSASKSQPSKSGGPMDIAPAFGDIKGRADALYVSGDALLNALLTSQQFDVNTLAVSEKLPTMFNQREMAKKGGLMSYGPSFPGLFRRAAEYVDKILRGAKPGDIPVEQPTQFEIVINLKTAKALGLTVPDKLLALADEVIE